MKKTGWSGQETACPFYAKQDFRMHRRKIYLALLILILTAGTYTVFQYHRIAKQKVEHVDIGEMIAMFQENEPLANATYAEKMIAVEGVIEEISFLNNRHTILLKGDTFTQHFILCDMATTGLKTTKKLQKGDTIQLKGVCKGYLLDVILLNCTPSNE